MGLFDDNTFIDRVEVAGNTVNVGALGIKDTTVPGDNGYKTWADISSLVTTGFTIKTAWTQSDWESTSAPSVSKLAQVPAVEVYYNNGNSYTTGTLSAAGAETKKHIYLIYHPHQGGKDTYDEYVSTESNTWEKIGNTDVTMTGTGVIGAPSKDYTSSYDYGSKNTSNNGAQNATGSATITVTKAAPESTGAATGGTDNQNTGTNGAHSHTVPVHTHGTAVKPATITNVTAGVKPSLTTTDSIVARVDDPELTAGSTVSFVKSASGTFLTALTGTKTFLTSASGTFLTALSGEKTFVKSIDVPSQVVTGLNGTTTFLTAATGTFLTTLTGTKTFLTAASGTFLNELTGTKTFLTSASTSKTPVVKATRLTVTNNVLSITFTTEDAVTDVTTSTGTVTASTASVSTSAGTIGASTGTVSIKTGSVGASTAVITYSSGTVSALSGSVSTSAGTIGASTASVSAPTGVLRATLVKGVNTFTQGNPLTFTLGNVTAAGAVGADTTINTDSVAAHSHTYTKPASHTHSITPVSMTYTGTAKVAVSSHTHSVSIGTHTHSLSGHTHSITITIG